MTDELKNGSWLSEMAERARLLLLTQTTSWENAEQEARRVHAKVHALGERVESNLNATVEASGRELKERVKNDVLRNRFSDLTRKELRIAAVLLFEIPLANLKALVVARPESHGMLLDAFCNQWTDRRDDPGRRGLTTLVMGAPTGVRVLHRGIRIDLADEETPARLAGRAPPELAKLIDLLQELGCRPTWQFSSEAVAAWISITASNRGAQAVWYQLQGRPRAANLVLPALREKQWGVAWPSGGGTAPVRTQVTVVVALLQQCLEHPNDESDMFLDKLLRFSRFGDPRMLPLSEHWRDLQAREPSLFNEFLGRLVREDLRLFFQHAMAAKDREEFWLLYIKSIHRTEAVLAQDTRKKLEQALRGTKEGRGVVERARVAQKGTLNAFCLYFEKVVVVEFSDVGNAAYMYRRDLFEQKILPPKATIEWAKMLKRKDVTHERILHSANWQIQAAQLLRDEGVHPSGI